MENKVLSLGPYDVRLNAAQIASLLPVFAASTDLARTHLAQATQEPLHGVAKEYIEAFEAVATSLKASGLMPPVVSGVDSHTLEAAERNPITRAVSGIYGFLVNPNHVMANPHSMNALRALHPIEEQLFAHGLSFST